MNPASHSAQHAPQQRYDLYGNIHKAIRRFMFDTVNAVGSVDRDDPVEMTATLAQVRLLADFCRGHLEHEDAFVHAAMEARRPGSADRIASEHGHHRAAIEQLHAQVAAVEHANEEARGIALAQLYRGLSVFVGENLVHMNIEETEHNAALWATYTDQELMAIEKALVASLTPIESATGMRWMIPAMNPQERAAKLGGIRLHAPAPMFDALMGIARETLAPGDFDKLAGALDAQERMAA